MFQFKSKLNQKMVYTTSHHLSSDNKLNRKRSGIHVVYTMHYTLLYSVHIYCQLVKGFHLIKAWPSLTKLGERERERQ